MLTVKIETDNEAFADESRGPELARILRKLADVLEEIAQGEFDATLRDINGNSCGKAVLR